jgi:hypothetical protein
MEPMQVPIPKSDAAWSYAASRADHPQRLRITRQGRRVAIALNGRAIGEDATCLANMRDDLLELIASGEFDCVIFDLTGVKVVLRGLLGLLACAHEQGCEVELLNPSQELQEIVRNAKLDTWVLVRGATT